MLLTNCSHNVAYVGLGGNIGDTFDYFQQALQNLYESFGIEKIIPSSIYQTTPMGISNQRDFLNMVVKVNTLLDYKKMFKLLLYIEKKFKKTNHGIWGPRTLDLDFLSYNDVIINSKLLKLPHPGVYFRNFVIIPWHEVDPSYILPSGVTIKELYIKCDKNIKLWQKRKIIIKPTSHVL